MAPWHKTRRFTKNPPESLPLLAGGGVTVLFTLLCSMAGVAVCFLLLAPMRARDEARSWQQLGRLPVTALRIHDYTGQLLIVEAVDGKLYGCSTFSGACNPLAAALPPAIDFCTPREQRYTPFTRGVELQRMLRAQCAVDGAVYDEFVLAADGSLWRRQSFSDGWGSQNALMGIYCAVVLVGSAGGLAFAWLVRRLLLVPARR